MVGGCLKGWSDGLALVHLVEALERRTLPGIERSPKAAAQRQRNYEKALEVLRLKKGMPLTHCYAAARLARADPSALVPLLLQVRLAYKTRTSKTQPLSAEGAAGVHTAGGSASCSWHL